MSSRQHCLHLADLHPYSVNLDLSIDSTKILVLVVIIMENDEVGGAIRDLVILQVTKHKGPSSNTR